jgi:predicted dehydrogenase
MKSSRRTFVKKTGLAASALSIGGIASGFSAQAYKNIVGANERITLACMGVNSRGMAVSTNFAAQKNAVVHYIADVDSRAAERCIAEVAKVQKTTPKAAPDFRKALDDKDLDALVVTAPDHWHAPAAIMACSAGKHVYLEKPCSHNPYEGELLLKAVDKFNRVIQMGNQRRSWPNVAAGIAELKAGIIGKVYYAKTWYTNNRASIGTGKKVEVPSWLDFELWQGPAPRKPFQDNLIHYNWHWFWHWGTGEALNNGTHMVDLARWGMDLEYPTRVSSAGGRYRYQDDWETPDTQVIDIEFSNKALITWEGRSCNGRNTEGSSVGVVFYGENGALQIDAGNAYKVFDLKNTLIKEVKNDRSIDARNLANPAQELDAIHLNNFLDAIKGKATLAADIQGGHQSTLLMQLGNIAQRTGRTLSIDPSNGHILNDREAMKLWKRTYEKGWEPKV